MLLQCTNTWDIHTKVLEPSADSACKNLCNEFVQGSLQDFKTVYDFGKNCDVLTIEIEHVNVEALKKLSAEGVKVHPNPIALETIQDKGLQKLFYLQNNFPTAEFVLCENKNEALAVAEKWNFQAVQKSRKAGYDGKGVFVCSSKNEAENLMDVPCVMERKVALKKEIAVIAARNENGEVKCFPSVEMDFHAGANMLDLLLFPAQIEAALEVDIVRRGSSFVINGSSKNIKAAAALIQKFYKKATDPIELEDVQLGLVEINKFEKEIKATSEINELKTKRSDLRGRTPRQNAYLKNIQDFDITFGIGPAGTGKTYLAVASAVDAINRDKIKRIVLVRPAVEAGERLGFLPGDLAQKVNPYLRPLYDALYDLAGYDNVHKMIDKSIIEIAPLAYMRGRTLNQSFIILDEAQNTTPEQMKMFLTRIGFGSKTVITGDITQIDLAKGQKSGLIEAKKILSKVKGIAFTHFLSEDVVRHPLVQKIINAYENFEKKESK